MRHLDLFSGIGGFALAAKEVWGDEYECVGFCDNNRFCQEVLKKRFPNTPIHGDIRTLTNANGNGLGRHTKPEEVQPERRTEAAIVSGGLQVDLITGGFPCQPFSHAGKRRGRSDNRFLWPEMLRVITEFRPRWVIAENVRGILSIEGGLVFEQVCLGLEKEGYAVQAFIIPACSVNAPHRRDRVWIVAHNTTSDGCRSGETATNEKGYAKRPLEDRQLERGFEGPHSNAPDAEGEPRAARQSGMLAGAREGQFGGGAGGCADTDSLGPRLERAVEKGEPRNSGRPAAQGGRQREVWNQNWTEVAAEFCRVDDGLPVELDGFKLSKAGHRVERLKALGNAIVPQVAVEIMRAIRDSELKRKEAEG